MSLLGIMYLLLVHFDAMSGPRIFSAIPSQLPPEIKNLAPRFLDIPLKDTVFEFITSGHPSYQFVNYPFEIPSPWARGNIETLLISAVFEQFLDIHTISPVIREIADNFLSRPEIFKGLYNLQKDPGCHKQTQEIEHLLQQGAKTVGHKEEQIQIANRAFTQKFLNEESTASQVTQIFNKVFITTIDARVPQGAAILFEAGTIIGNNLVPIFISDNSEALLAEAAAFWRKYALGQIDDIRTTPNQLRFNVYECFECSHYPNIGRPVCKFDEGVLTSLLSKKLQQSIKVTETDCFATGKGRCCFTVDIEPLIPRKF
ncbi:MAG: ArsR family transcriptional regulator [Promethearchaeota archaeon CR_4]|nr:MAG: ArsR family transcriptional regulator [Candidatus Lokiarchaeota archaeon CR_4]